VFCARCGTRAAAGEGACSLCGAPLPGGGLGGAAGGPPFPAAVVPVVGYGGFWRRFAALVLDSFVLFFPNATLRVLLGLDPVSFLDLLAPSAWAASLFEMLLGWIYGAGLIASPAAGTLGQRVLDLRVTELHGGRVGFLRASWRYWAQILSVLSLGVGYLMQLATPRRQTLHDLVSATLVVRARHARRAEFAPAAGGTA